MLETLIPVVSGVLDVLSKRHCCPVR